VKRSIAAIVGMLAAGCVRCPRACEAPCPPPHALPRAETPADDVDRAVAWMEAVVAKPPTTEAEGVAAASELGRLHRRQVLREALHRLARRLKGTHPQLASRLDHADRAVEMVGQALCLRGLTAPCAHVRYEPWEAIAARHAGVLAASKVPREERRVDDPRYVAEMEAVSGAEFQDGYEVELLVDGPASWKARRAAIEGARTSLEVLTWAIYDDPTGWEAVRSFVDAAKRGVRVRVVVDGQVAAQPGYDKPVAWLREQGKGLPIEVVAWRDAARPFAGQHRKILTSDLDVSIAGGMNFGDVYSHQNPKRATRWRDTDIGWRKGGTARVAVVEQKPGEDEHVHLHLLKAIDAARESIDVENAYYVRVPSVERALVAARGRGVRVRLLTNSAESLDEPILAVAILESLRPLFDAGVECWLKRGDTLHSKFLVVDGVFLTVGSYNLHPRSYRMERELTVSVLSREHAATLTAAFESDLAAAKRATSAADLTPPDDPVGRLALLLFPDLL
jgi:cardiolipin synthase A/B